MLSNEKLRGRCHNITVYLFDNPDYIELDGWSICIVKVAIAFFIKRRKNEKL
jgi:hypothetical protein